MNVNCYINGNGVTRCKTSELENLEVGFLISGFSVLLPIR